MIFWTGAEIQWKENFLLSFVLVAIWQWRFKEKPSYIQGLTLGGGVGVGVGGVGGVGGGGRAILGCKLSCSRTS